MSGPFSYVCVCMYACACVSISVYSSVYNVKQLKSVDLQWWPQVL